MKRIFVDTSAWIALLDGNDAHHQRAVMYFEQIKHDYLFVSSNYVMDELYTLSLMSLGYSHSIQAYRMPEKLETKGSLMTVWIDEALGATSWSIFEKYNVDKSWSFTDCASFGVMKEIDISEVFTFDRHFTQMGFDKRPV